MLIGYAFRISPDRVTGPQWMTGVGSPRFNIAATYPAETSKGDIRVMLQTLLAERFQLAVRRATATRSVYALVPAGNVIIMKRASQPQSPEAPSPDEESPDGFYGETQTFASTTGASGAVISNARMGSVRQTGDPFKGQRWEASNISMAGLADLLDKVAPLSLPVVDRTRLTGRFELVLEVSLPRATQSSAEMDEGVLDAFNSGLKKLALRLERRTGQVETIVVDRVLAAPTPN